MLTLNALTWAWRRVRENRGAAGADGITLQRFGRMLDTNLLDLAAEVHAGAYRPGPVRYVMIQEPGKVRRLAILTVRDRVLQRAALDRLGPILEPRFLPSSFAYRPGRSVQDAVERIVRLRNRGLVHVVDADIRDCFGSLDHTVLQDTLDRQVPGMSDDLRDLIHQWITMPHRSRQHRRDRPRTRGILQGAPISPLLCNLYLHEMDRSLARRRLSLVRYADDFVVLCRSPEHATRAMRTVQKVLRGLRLTLHPGKTMVTDFERGFDFLGVRFEDDRYSYVSEGRHIIINDLPPDWFHDYPDEYA